MFLFHASTPPATTGEMHSFLHQSLAERECQDVRPSGSPKQKQQLLSEKQAEPHEKNMVSELAVLEEARYSERSVMDAAADAWDLDVDHRQRSQWNKIGVFVDIGIKREGGQGSLSGLGW